MITLRWKHLLLLLMIIVIAAILYPVFNQEKDPFYDSINYSDPITEISIEHQGCFGICPIYKLIIHKDRTATFIGRAFTSKIGTYKRHVNGLPRLKLAIHELGFFKFKSSYHRPITDMEHIITSVTENGKTKSVMNYADSGPQNLWIIQKLIDGVVVQTKWEKVSDKTESSEYKR